MAQDPVKKPESANPEVTPDIDASADIDARIRKDAVAAYGPVDGPILADRLAKGRAAALANQPSQQSVYRARWAGELEEQNDHLDFIEGLYGASPVGDLIRVAMKRISAAAADIRGATDESFDADEILGKVDDIHLELSMIFTTIVIVLEQPPLANGLYMALERVNLVSEDIANREPLPPKGTIYRRRSRHPRK